MLTRHNVSPHFAFVALISLPYFCGPKIIRYNFVFIVCSERLVRIVQHILQSGQKQCERKRRRKKRRQNKRQIYLQILIWLSNLPYQAYNKRYFGWLLLFFLSRYFHLCLPVFLSSLLKQKKEEISTIRKNHTPWSLEWFICFHFSSILVTHLICHSACLRCEQKFRKRLFSIHRQPK